MVWMGRLCDPGNPARVSLPYAVRLALSHLRFPRRSRRLRRRVRAECGTVGARQVRSVAQCDAAQHPPRDRSHGFRRPHCVVGINSVLALSGLRLPLPSWETVLLSVLFVADLPLLSWLQRAQQRRRRNVEGRYVRGDRAEVIRAFRARLESRGSAFRYEDKGRALKPYIAPTFFLARDSLVLLVPQSRPRQVYLIRRRGPEVPEKTTAEIDTILEEALASSG